MRERERESLTASKSQNRQNTKKRNLIFRENYFFLAVICLFFITGAYTFVKNPNKTSTTENRSLVQFDHFTISKFLNGTFQTGFENTISDQFPLREKIYTTYGETVSNLPTFNIYQSICNNHYVEIINNNNSNRMTFNCDDYIVLHPNAYNIEKEAVILNKNIARYNHINELSDTYYYYIADSGTYDFEQNRIISDYANLLTSNLRGNYHFAQLEWQNYDEFKNYFYKTDHHWNHIGSYQGFLDIAKMLKIRKPVTPLEEFTNHEIFFGSHARITRNFSYTEEFAVYQFDLPKHDTYINKQAKNYGNYKDFFSHNYTYNKTTNFYGYFYGMDYGEILFDYHQPKEDNLLIISNSFSNAVNELIAQYFNKTFVVDLRHYRNHIGEKFVLSDYINNNSIDKVLVILSPSFLRDESLNQGLEL